MFRLPRIFAVMPTVLSEKILPKRHSKMSKANITRDIIGACSGLLITSAGDMAEPTSSDVDTPGNVRAVLTSMGGRNKRGAWSIDEDEALLSARRQLLAAGDTVGKLERVSELSNADCTVESRRQAAKDRVKKLRKFFRRAAPHLIDEAGLQIIDDTRRTDINRTAAPTATAASAARPPEERAAAARRAAATRTANAASAPFPWLLTTPSIQPPVKPVKLSYDTPFSLDVPHGPIPFGAQTSVE